MVIREQCRPFCVLRQIAPTCAEELDGSNLQSVTAFLSTAKKSPRHGIERMKAASSKHRRVLPIAEEALTVARVPAKLNGIAQSGLSKRLPSQTFVRDKAILNYSALRLAFTPAAKRKTIKKRTSAREVLGSVS